ncbi:hypothetical protein AWT69_004251 [Pseudomonas putida]|nr:hypothetical protein AWT69_004251 [Pseudomonas putida]
MWKVTVTNTAESPTEENTVNIFPVNAAWNDFGYNFHAQARFLINGAYREANLRIIPFPNDKPASNVSEYIKDITRRHQNQEPPLTGNNKYPAFVTVFSSIYEYTRLADLLPIDAYDDLLVHLGEINALLWHEIITSDTYAHIVATPQFANGVLRKNGTYKAFKYGYLKGNRIKPPEDARIPFSFAACLNDEDNHTVNFSYRENDLLPDRVHCLIGMNGVGKTRYLRSLILAIQEKINTVSESKVPSQLFDKKGDATDASWISGADNWINLPPFSRVCVYSTDPHNILPRRTNLRGSFDYIYFDMGLEEEAKLSNQLADLIRSDDRLGSDERFVLFKKVMQKTIPNAQLLIPVHSKLNDAAKVTDQEGEEWIPLAALRGNELRILDILNNIDESRDLAFRKDTRGTIPLSSGQKMFFRFATHFLSVADQGTLVLIDEPETHLHPNLITEFMNLLYDVLVYTSSIAIVATHSTYVVREAPSHCVHVFRRRENNNIAVEQFYIKTLGASVSELSDTIFGDSLVEAFNDKIVKKILEKQLPIEETIKRYSDILSMDMLIKIKNNLVRKGQ